MQEARVFALIVSSSYRTVDLACVYSRGSVAGVGVVVSLSCSTRLSEALPEGSREGYGLEGASSEFS